MNLFTWFFNAGITDQLTSYDRRQTKVFNSCNFAGMLIAIVLITIGRGVAKKSIPDAAKFKRSFWLFLIALVIILATVPWPFREGIGKPWL